MYNTNNYLILYLLLLLTTGCNTIGAVDSQSICLVLLSFLFDRDYSVSAFLLLVVMFQLILTKGFINYLVFFFFCNNFILRELTNFFQEVNFNLWGGLTFIHPVTTILAYAGAYIYISFKWVKFFKYKDFFIFQKKFKTCLFVLSAFAIIWGAWWAQQELNWGGWWGWDNVEMGLLFFLIYIVIQLHTRFFFKIKKIFFLVFFICGVRFNFFVTIHSFLIEQNFVVTWYFFFFLTIVMYFFFIIEKKKAEYMLATIVGFFILELVNGTGLHLHILILALTAAWLITLSYNNKLINISLPLPVFFIILIALVKNKKFYHFLWFLFFNVAVFFKQVFYFEYFYLLREDVIFCINENITTQYNVACIYLNKNTSAYAINFMFLDFVWTLYDCVWNDQITWAAEIFCQGVIFFSSATFIVLFVFSFISYLPSFSFWIFLILPSLQLKEYRKVV